MADEHEAYVRARAALSEADRAIARALEARARAVRAIVALRAERPEAYLQLPRIEEVLADVEVARSEAGRALPDAAIEPIYREILGACALLAAPLRVALAGLDPSLAAVAARKVFGSIVELVTRPSVEDALRAIERGEASCAVVPLETGSDGTSAATLFTLARSAGRIVGEVTIPNAYHLYSRTGNASDVEKIYATPIALTASSRSLERDFPSATVIEVRAASVAAELAAGDHGGAAVATSDADAPGLALVRSHVEDDGSLETRFVVVGREASRRTGRDRTVIVLELGEEPGSLYAALEPFARRGINLTRVESRRAPGSALGSTFFLEFDGHASDRAIVSVLDDVRGKSRLVKVLGSFPRPTREGESAR